MDQTIKSRVAIYARVSTLHGQTTDNQMQDLDAFCNMRGWTVKERFVDEGVSGFKDDRPRLNEMMNQIRRHKFDAVLVWALDRFARSVKHLVLSLDEFRELKVDFIAYKQNIDTSTSQGRLMFHVIAGMAEFERELIRERVFSGLRRVKAQGKRLGRPTLPDEVKAKIYALSDSGMSLRHIADQIEWVRASGKYGNRKVMPISKSVVAKVLKGRPQIPPQNVAFAIDETTVG